MSYDWKIELDSVDITDKVARFQIEADLSQYCRELTVEIADPDFYDDLDFSTIPSAPLLEVFTMVDAAWVSQGTYYMERPALSSDINQDVINGLWGRGATACLGAPFAPRVSKMWTTNTSFLSIVAEMCALAGLDWDDSQCAIDDFYIFAYTYQVENAYPIDVISELCALAGAIPTADRAGDLIITVIDYAPTTADVTIDDDDWATITETPEWPDFGNRVRIIPTGSLAGYSISLTVPDACLPADGASQAKIYARVTDADGDPVAGEVVAWSMDADEAALAYATSNTIETVMPPEEVRAANQYTITLAVPPSAVLGVYAYADFARRDNLAAAGYSIDGATVTLTAPMEYCDQLVRVVYMAAGMAVNYVQAGDVAEDVSPVAEIGGQSAAVDIYIGNGCQCPATLRLDAVPGSIEINETGQLIVYAEDSGGPVEDGRLVRLFERTALSLGALQWTTARLGSVAVSNEKTEAVNEVSGVSQCAIKRFPVGTPQVYAADISGSPTGANLYAGHTGKTIDLSTTLSTGTALVVHYTAEGAALNYFASNGTPGTAYFRATMKTNREEPLEADVSVSITDPADPTSGDTGDDYTGGDYGGIGGSDGGLDTTFNNGCSVDGSDVTQCAEGEDWASDEVCCEKDGVLGCHLRGDCDGYQPGLDCVPANISDNPEADAAARFDDALGNGCTCEEACAAEFNLYGTTQTHDGGSYRTVAEVLEQDQGLSEVEGGDNSAYWTAFAAERDAALEACVSDCKSETMQCHPSNPETFSAQFESLTMRVLGGAAPYTWSVSGSHSLGEEDAPYVGNAETLLPANDLNTNAQDCGRIQVTVTDAAANTVTCTLINPNGGQWLPGAGVSDWYTADKKKDTGGECAPQNDDMTTVYSGSAFKCATRCWFGSTDPWGNPYDCPDNVESSSLADLSFGSGCSGSCGGRPEYYCVALKVKVYACPEEAAYYASLDQGGCLT